MKLLLVLGSDDTYNLITIHIKPLGFDLIRYQNVLKAMDNVDEADPTGIIISARDYPWHWKAFVQFIRSERPKNVCPIIILKGDNFSIDDTTKAHYLGTSGIISEDLKEHSEIIRMQEILCRYLPAEEKRRSRRYHVQAWQQLNFIMTVPEGEKLITGELKTISSGGLSFLPDYPNLMKTINLHDKLPLCSLRVGDAFLSPVCRLVRTGRIISMEFLNFPENEQHILDDYLLYSPFLERKIREENAAQKIPVVLKSL